jgi:hypothetical protein
MVTAVPAARSRQRSTSSKEPRHERHRLRLHGDGSPRRRVEGIEGWQALCTLRIGDGDAVQWVSVMFFGADAADLAPRILKGTRVYTEGTLRLDTWEQEGKQRTGLSVMSWHCRVAAIGQHRPKRERKPAEKPHGARSRANNFYNDEIGF